MPSARLCSECGTPLPPNSQRNRLTCKDACRTARSKRLRREKAEREAEKELPEEVRRIRQVTRNERDDVVSRVIQDELRPVVRESITDDTMRAIEDLVALTPKAVSAIAEDVASDDAVIRQRAYSLLMKYTVGHQAIVRPPDQDPNAKLEVHFNVPRPDAPAEEPEPEAEVIEAPAVDEEDTQECDMCHASKPLSEFIAGSYRCKDCFTEQQTRAANLFPDKS